MIEAYCVRCRKKVSMESPKKTKTKKGTPMTKGVCPECGTIICRMGE